MAGDIGRNGVMMRGFSTVQEAISCLSSIVPVKAVGWRLMARVLSSRGRKDCEGVK